MEKRKVYRRTTRFMLWGAAVLAGLAWARVAPEIAGWLVVISGLMALMSFRRARLISVYSVLLFGLLLGWWRGGQLMGEMRYLESIHKDKVVIIGTALQDSVYDERGGLAFDAGSLLLEIPDQRPIAGKVGVSGRGEKMVYRGDRVRITGKFYPSRGSLVARLNYAELEVVSRSQSVVFKITREFGAGMLSAVPEPQASFGMGLLIGQRNTLPENTSDILAAVGLTHIIAVSGYNLTILVRATRRMLARRSKFQAMTGAVILIFGFLLVTGASPSIVRASIISLLALGAWYYGRVVRPMVLILLTAAGTALWNPLYIWSDISWYLSFLAFFGVLVIAPLARKRFLGDKQRGILTEVLLESTAAQLMTLPLILFIFNESSLIVLLANLLVVPLIPLAMLLSFTAGMAGVIMPSLAGWLAWPANWLLTYLLDVAALVSRIPHMRYRVSITDSAMIMLYGLIVACAFIWWQKAAKAGKITDTNFIE